VLHCAHCGGANDEGSRFCIDCGKPLASTTYMVLPAVRPSAPFSSVIPPVSSMSTFQSGAQAARAIVLPTQVAPAPATSPERARCQWCHAAVDASLPFCGQCGRRVDATLTSVRTLVFSAERQETGLRVVVLDESGAVRQTYPVTKAEMSLGRGESDVRFPDDPFLSPLHARIVVRDGATYVRDLGSCNRTWVFITEPFTLADDDCVLLGSQILHFRQLGTPAPVLLDADGTRRLGSATPGADVAALAQLRADGSVRDVHHLSLGRSLMIGRDTGDWLFPYDLTMSGRHAEIREEAGRFVIRDVGSRNGVAIAVRGERRIAPGQRVLAGDVMLRVESV